MFVYSRRKYLDISKYNYLKNLDFADKYTSDNSEKSIDILIGMDYYFNFVRCDKESTEVRAVFDEWAKNGNKPSLNDCLYAGPCLLRQLYDILVRFCLHNIILMSDIKKHTIFP